MTSRDRRRQRVSRTGARGRGGSAGSAIPLASNAGFAHGCNAGSPAASAVRASAEPRRGDRRASIEPLVAGAGGASRTGSRGSTDHRSRRASRLFVAAVSAPSIDVCPGALSAPRLPARRWTDELVRDEEVYARPARRSGSRARASCCGARRWSASAGSTTASSCTPRTSTSASGSRTRGSACASSRTPRSSTRAVHRRRDRRFCPCS